MLDQIVGYMFETGLEIAVNNLPHVLRQTVAKVVAKKGTDLYYTIRGEKTDREILVELNGKINSLGTSSEAMEAIAVIKQYTESFNESFKQNAQIYEEISGLNERLRSGALENQLKLQLTDVLNEILSHYGVKLDKIDGLVRKSTSELHIRFDDVEEMLNRFGGDLGYIRMRVDDILELLRQHERFSDDDSDAREELLEYLRDLNLMKNNADKVNLTQYDKLSEAQKRALFRYYDVNRNTRLDETNGVFCLVSYGRFMKEDYFSEENLFYEGQSPRSKIPILMNLEKKRHFSLLICELQSRIFNRLCNSGIGERYHIMFVRRLDKLIECEHDQENELAKINQEKIMNELAELGVPDSFYEGQI